MPPALRPPRAGALEAEPYRIFDDILLEDLQELADDIRGFKVGGPLGGEVGWLPEFG